MVSGLLLHLGKACGCKFPVFWLCHLQNGPDWNAVVKPKAHGALNLDAATQGLPHLEHFIVFSSIVASIGNDGMFLPVLL
jgi:hypothetical protein